MKPLLFLDVDGPLNPYAAKPSRRPEGYQTHRLDPLFEDGTSWSSVHRKPLRVWLNPEHGSQLLSLSCDLVWATTWEHDANRLIAPLVGLPELPVVEFTKPIKQPMDHTHWKLRDLITYAAGRPFAWLDDEITTHDRDHLIEVSHSSTLPLQVSPVIGITDDHLTQVCEWRQALNEMS